MFDTFIRRAVGLFDKAAATAERLLNADELGRLAAVVAMMAYLPDGNADDDEIEAGIAAILHRFGPIYKPSDLAREIRERVDVLKESRRFGKADLMAQILPARYSPEADFLVQVAAAVGEAPDESLPKGADPFTPAERALAREIAAVLSVDPVAAGL
jgi:tellurite resistance protein